MKHTEHSAVPQSSVKPALHLSGVRPSIKQRTIAESFGTDARVYIAPPSTVSKRWTASHG